MTCIDVQANFLLIKLLIVTIVVFDLRTDVISLGNGEVKIQKFTHNFKSIVIDRNLNYYASFCPDLLPDPFW